VSGLNNNHFIKSLFFHPPAPPDFKVVYELRGPRVFYGNGCFLIPLGSTPKFVVNIEIGGGGWELCTVQLQ